MNNDQPASHYRHCPIAGWAKHRRKQDITYYTSHPVTGEPIPHTLGHNREHQFLGCLECWTIAVEDKNDNRPTFDRGSPKDRIFRPGKRMTA